LGGIKKALSSVTDLVGLTDTAALEAQQKAAKEQLAMQQAQAQLENDQSGEQITQVESGGAAATSAAGITADQKRRRAGAVSNSLGI
jgi:hypothetical protein